MLLVGWVESLVDQQPGIGARCTQIQLADTTQDDVGARRVQLLLVPGVVDSYHQSETAGVSCLDPGGILDDHGTLRGYAESTCRLEEHRRIRFAGQTLICGHQAVNDHIKCRIQARGLQQSLRVTTGCDEAHGGCRRAGVPAAPQFRDRHRHRHGLMRSGTGHFLGPNPATDQASGPSSGLPVGSWMPRKVRKARMPSSRLRPST